MNISNAERKRVELRLKDAKINTGTVIDIPFIEKNDLKKFEKVLELLKMAKEDTELFEDVKRFPTTMERYIAPETNPKNYKSKRLLIKNIEDKRNLFEAFYLLGETDEDNIKELVAKKSYKEKINIQKAIAKFLQDGKITLENTNAKLKFFDKQITRKLVGRVTKDNKIAVPTEVAPMLRSQCSGVFYNYESDIANTASFLNYKPEKTTKKDYNLMEKSEMFKMVKTCPNMQAVSEHVSELLAQKGVPCDVAHNMNYQDFYDLISDGRKANKIKMKNIIELKAPVPEEEFLKAIFNNKVLLTKIMADMKASGKTPEEINIWRKNLENGIKTNGDEVHHKGFGIKYANIYEDPTKASALSELCLAAKYSEVDAHAEEHLFDCKRLSVLRDGEIRRINATNPEKALQEGDYIVVEEVVTNKVSEKTAYFSETASIEGKIGNDENKKIKAPTTKKKDLKKDEGLSL